MTRAGRRPSPAWIAAAAVSVLGGSVGLLVARGEPDARSPRGTLAASPAARAGDTLRVVADEDLDALDPQRAGSPRSWFVARALHRGLLAFPHRPFPDGARPVLDLAERMEVSADGLRYTFRLRDGVRFGPPASRPVGGPDVRAGIERLMRSGRGVARWFEPVRRIRAAPLTVVVELSRPSNDIPWLLALPQASAVPRELEGRVRVPPASISPAGPYRIAAYEPERRIRLVRNPAWRAATDPVRAAHVDEIEVELAVAPDAQPGRIASGRADLSLDAPGAAPSGAQVATAANGCLRYLWMNTTVAPFDDPRVRRAVAASVDRAAIAQTYAVPSLRGATPAGGILPPTVFGSVGPGRAPAPRVEQAGAGAATLVVGDTALDRRQAAVVARGARAAGVRVAVRRVPLATLYADLYEVPARRVAMGIATWCADWPGLGGRGVIGALLDGRLVRSSGNTVSSLLRSPALERAIDRAGASPTHERAVALWRKADRLARGLAAVVPLAWLEEISLIGSRVRGFVPHPFFARGDPTGVWLDRGL